MDEKYELIKEQNRNRAKKYYETHKNIIAIKNKSIKNGTKLPNKMPDPIIIDNTIELKQIQNNIITLIKEVDKLKKSTIMPEKIEKINKYLYTLDEAINLINNNIENENSKKLYIINIKNIYDILNTNNLFNALKPYKKAIFKIRTITTKRDDTKGYSINSMKGLFQVILKIIQLYNMPLSEKAKEAYIEQFELLKIDSTTQTETRKENVELLDFDEYLNIVKNKFGIDSKPYLIVSLFNVSGFRDDFKMIVLDKIPPIINNEENYIIIPSDARHKVIILLNQYKTVGKYGIEKIEVNKDISKLLRNYIINNKIKFGDYLFKSQSLSGYVIKFNKELNLNYSLNTIRKMVVSSTLNTKEIINDSSKRLKLAKKMHHNASTSIKSYLHNTKTI
jgi:BRCT domain type II-containing protein